MFNILLNALFVGLICLNSGKGGAFPVNHLLSKSLNLEEAHLAFVFFKSVVRINCTLLIHSSVNMVNQEGQ